VTGDLKENWFLCFPIKHSTHTQKRPIVGAKEPSTVVNSPFLPPAVASARTRWRGGWMGKERE